MIKTTLSIEGMACSMCEAHINDAVRNNFNVKKVISSHSKGITEIISENEIDEEKVKKVIGNDRYTVTAFNSEPYEKKGFSFFKKTVPQNSTPNKKLSSVTSTEDSFYFQTN